MTEIDKRSREWREVEQWAEEKLSEERRLLEEENADASTDVRLTAGLRRSIATLKQLLALPERKEPTDTTQDTGYGVGSDPKHG
jgi:hypothetical protein|tara:strand:+ start:5045 stop:5296 length:252 start_codon:yes stop_codon:yes gene_type:complete